MKKFKFFLSVFVPVILAGSCKLSFFKEVHVTANPRIRVNCGQKDVHVDDYVSVKDLVKYIEDTEMLSSSKIFDYRPDDDGRLLIYYPIANLDMNKLDEKLTALRDAEKVIRKTLEPMTFKFPDIPDQEKDTDISGLQNMLTECLNESKTMFKIPTDISGSFPSTPLSITIAPPFKQATFAAGSTLTITPHSPAGLSVTIDSVKLKNAAGNDVPYTTNGGKAVLDLGNVVLAADGSDHIVMNLSFSGSGTATAGKFVTFGMKFEGTVLEATGINIPSKEIAIGDIDIPFDADPRFVEAKVDDGTLTMMIAIPEGWTGITLDCSPLQLDQDGTMLAHFTNISGGARIDLAGKTIKAAPLKIKGKLGVTASNGTYQHVTETKITVKPALKKLAYAKLKMPNTFVPKYTHSEPLPYDFQQWVESIKISELSIKLNINNGLPEGNDLVLTASSAALDMASETAQFPAGARTEKELKKENFVFLPHDHSALDFAIDLGFAMEQPGNILTVNNIDTSKEASISGDITIRVNWDEAIINPPSSAGIKGAYPAKSEDRLSLNEFTELVKKGLHFENINLYLYASSNLTPPLNLEGNMYFDHKKNASLPAEKTNDDYVLGDIMGNYASLPLCSSTPSELNTLENGSIYRRPLPPPSVPPLDVAKILTSNQGDLKFNYEVKVGKTTIKKATLPEHAKIEAAVVLEMPLAVTALPDDGVVIKTFESDGDILKRSEPTNNASVDKAKKYVKKLTLYIDYNNPMNFDAFARINNGFGYLERTALLERNKSGRIAVEFTDADIDYVLNNVPVKVKVDLIVPKGFHSLQPDRVMKLNLYSIADVAVDETFSIHK